MNKEWLPLYAEIINERRYYTNKAWETIKFFTTIYTALLSFTILIVMNIYDKNPPIDIYIVIIVISLPVNAMLLSFIGWWNFKRENSRAYETMATLKKVEKLIGLHEEINEEDRYFKKDKYLLPNYFVEEKNEKVKSEDTKYFIDWMFKKETKSEYGTFYSTFTNVFIIYFIIALLLVILLLGWGLSAYL